MTYKHKPIEMTFYAPDDAPFRVRYDHDPGEEQWFDARAGVGSPGYPAGVMLTEVNFGERWEPVENYPQINVEAIEASIMEKIDEEAGAYWEAYAEREQERT